jgi:hypothetical protein
MFPFVSIKSKNSWKFYRIYGHKHFFFLLWYNSPSRPAFLVACLSPCRQNRDSTIKDVMANSFHIFFQYTTH